MDGESRRLIQELRLDMEGLKKRIAKLEKAQPLHLLDRQSLPVYGKTADQK